MRDKDNDEDEVSHGLWIKFLYRWCALNRVAEKPALKCPLGSLHEINSGKHAELNVLFSGVEDSACGFFFFWLLHSKKSARLWPVSLEK